MSPLPELPAGRDLAAATRNYLIALARAGFRGDIATDWAQRTVRATDNSIYQLTPSAVLMPRSAEDVCIALATLHDGEFPGVHLTPRGGGTGTNGQSLTDAVVLDLSRHMNAIAALDPDRREAMVEPGVIRDALNDRAAEHGLFFPPTVSPSNRATLGGMINTDACGKGSRIYGRSGDHVLALKVVLADGSLIDTAAPPDDARLRALQALLTEHRALIEARFPALTRSITGYNLRDALRDGMLDLNRLFAGAEGSLGVIVEATLRLTPLPVHRTLLLVEYADFDAALNAAREMLAHEPGAIETADETVLDLARGDIIWHRVRGLFQQPDRVRAINLVEFEGDDAAAVTGRAERLRAELAPRTGQPGHPIAVSQVDNAADRRALWDLRKKGVGLLGRLPGDRKPVAFMEDTVVPPERLPEYVAELRSLLDAHGLRYGMFGHVDVGCLHVRPALNLRDPADQALVRRLSDAVSELVLRHGGLFWGEHGKGFRAEYAPRFMGAELYALMCRVKALFDPEERLNPGKIARVAPDLPLIPLDAVPTRGDRDRRIADVALNSHRKAVECNGNGACFDYRVSEVMCPSYRATGDRRHSPKGRAMLIREWLARASEAGYRFPAYPNHGWANPRHTPDDLSHQVKLALDGCLGCKACATQCPVQVNVPALRSRFLGHYHGRYRRPLRDWLLYALEPALVAGTQAPRLAAAAICNPVSRAAALRLGLTALPQPQPGFAALARRYRLSSERVADVVLVPDPFTPLFEPQVWQAAVALLERLGFAPRIALLQASGKARHNQGFRRGFERQRDAVTAALAPLAARGLPLVSLEPSHLHLLRQEYAEEGGASLPVQSLPAWLGGLLPGDRLALRQRWQLLGHCTDRSLAPDSASRWRALLRHFGVDLEAPEVGCCGMAGTYGHETRHQRESRALFEASWQPVLEAAGRDGATRLVATGFSCRSQIRRFGGGREVAHPVVALNEYLSASGA
jgi:FAD/FMN-containing dehydrogenase/Fe-S oxidoreductase